VSYVSFIETLEDRRLLSTTWAPYAKLVTENTAATDFPKLTGKGVAIAMIDTGIDYNLPELGGGFGPGFKVEAGHDFYSNDNDPMDEDGHGTDTAFVVAGNPITENGVTYQGVAPQANLIALRVGTETDIPDANIQAALEWVIANYKKYNIQVVNLSLGSGNYTSAQTQGQISVDFATLKSDGLFVTAASGNSQDQERGPIQSDGVAFPAADPSVFAVGAVDSSDVIADFTQRGSELDLLAPGVDIEMPTLTNTFTTEDGTSFSSPYVAGTAALIKQEDPTAGAGDVGSILMSSGVDNRDGDNETGNTTGLLFSRLDIDSALKLTEQRVGVSSTIDLGTDFDTAVDSDGVLHAAYYDSTNGRLLYATRDVEGLWSKSYIVDNSADVGAQLSIAVDTTAHVGIGYFDDTNTAIKYANYTGTKWSTTTIDSEKNVGTSPSLAFDVNGNAYLAYYKRSGGYLRMATLDRDTGRWTRQTIDDGSGDDVGKDVSLDVEEAAVNNGGFTQYDTNVAMAYSDETTNSLKYARFDLDNSNPSTADLFSTVEAGDLPAHIELHLHASPSFNSTVQAQIAYQDTTTADVKYAFRDTNWFVEDVATTGKLGDTVQMYFDSDDNPFVVYYDRVKRTLSTATRTTSGDGDTGTWSSKHTATSSGPMIASYNVRTGVAVLTYLNRPKTAVTATTVATS
jgi:subtilisin family serine protease